MERIIHLVGKTSSEIFMLRYPRSLLNFCDFDFVNFAESAIALCDEALRSGEPDLDCMTELRNSLKAAHVYIEHNIRTVYDKIVLDCWIDYVCRRDNVGTSALWNRFITCSNAFEKAVFVRLCEYRYNKAINEWLNLVRVQDYAKNKMQFLFSHDLKGVEEAAARRNYFDLMFSVTARELGCNIEELGVTKVFSVGRLPSAPFMFPNISKEVVKNVLSDFDYSEDYSDYDSYSSISDQIAMDAFSYMKPGLEQEMESHNISRSEMENSPVKVYMPCGLKSMIDLEIDVLIESGGWIARCKRCGRYYVRDTEHNEEYCSLYSPSGKTCLELYEQENPRSRLTPEINRLCDEITDEMYGRVNDGTLSLKEYESWKLYLEAMRGKVDKGEINPEELTDFISYSQSLDITRSHPVVEVPKKEPEPPKERGVVRPFVPERIDRSELLKQEKPEEPEEEEEEPAPQPRRESFFTSPTVERKKNIAHIIRADSAAAQTQTAPNVFTPFGGAPIPVTQPVSSERPAQSLPQYTREEQQPQSQQYAREERQPQSPQYAREERQPQSPQYVREERQAQSPQYAREERQPEFPRYVREEQPQQFPRYVQEDFSQQSYSRDERPSQPSRQRPEPPRPRAYAEPEFTDDREPAPFMREEYTAPSERRSEQGRQGGNIFDMIFGDIPYEKEQHMESSGTEFDFAPEQELRGQSEISEEPVRTEPPAPPRPRVVRKNAAAISAYGKAAGAVLTPPPEFQQVSRPEEPPLQERAERSEREMPLPTPEEEPFSNIGSIFDMLEQAENDMSRPLPGSYREERRQAPPPEESEPEPPEEVTAQNVPSGIWTEDRGLYEDEDSELEMLKEKKRSRSSKTQRLFDAIMREPEDNPNFRRR